MPPGRETFQYFGRLGENGLHHGRHECLPYCRNITCSEIYKHQFICMTCIAKRYRHCQFDLRRSLWPLMLIL